MLAGIAHSGPAPADDVRQTVSPVQIPASASPLVWMTPSSECSHRDGSECSHRDGAECSHSDGAEGSHRDGAECFHRDGAECSHNDGAECSHRDGAELGMLCRFCSQHLLLYLPPHGSLK